MKNTGDIALFLQVLDSGSISAAARHMDLSAAVVSQRLQRLETELGVRLLHRTTRRLHPTPEGLVLAEEGRPLMEALATLSENIRQHHQEASGVLRVTAPASFGNRYLVPLLPEFLAAHPQLHIKLHLDDRIVDVIGEGYDLAIRIGQLADSSLVSRHLAENARVLCAAPAYLQQRGTPQTLHDLTQHDCLIQSERDETPGLWRLTDGDGRVHSVHVHGRFQSNFGDALRQAALAGLGIAQHSLWHIQEDVAAGRLHIVLPAFRPPASGIYAVMPTRTLQPARVRLFTDYLAASFAQTVWR